MVKTKPMEEGQPGLELASSLLAPPDSVLQNKL